MPSLWPASVWNSTGALGVEMSPMKETQRSLTGGWGGKQHFPLFRVNCVLGSVYAVLASPQLPSGSQREY